VNVLKSFKLGYSATLLYFGPESIWNIEKHVESFKRVVIAAGKTSAKESGALDDVLKILDKYGIEYTIFNNIRSNPWASQAEELAKTIWEYAGDGVIAIGGGSVIDTAKVASVIAASGGRAVDYSYMRLKAKRHVPLIAVNLTHGTGTEIDRYAVITIDETREKRGIGILYPDASVDDPKYTLTLPKNQTAFTSIDAFYHSYEGATAKITSPIVILLAYESTRLIKEWLRKSLDNLNLLEPRYWLMYSSMLAGIVEDASSTHIIHAIEHSLSGFNPDLPHGCGLSIIGPRAIYYVHKAAPEESASVLRAIDPSVKPISEDAEKAMRVVKEFQEQHELGYRLGDYGFARSDIDKIIKMTMEKLSPMYAQTPFTVSADIIRDIIEHSL